MIVNAEGNPVNQTVVWADFYNDSKPAALYIGGILLNIYLQQVFLFVFVNRLLKGSSDAHFPQVDMII